LGDGINKFKQMMWSTRKRKNLEKKKKKKTKLPKAEKY
jgi:hypothetical protein